MGEVVNGLLAIGTVLVIGAIAKHATLDRASSQPRQRTYSQETAAAPAINPQSDRRVIASAKIAGDRCVVEGSVNSRPPTPLEIDTGNDVFASFSASYVGDKLGINPASVPYVDMWPGTPYGKHAFVTIREIRIGDVVWRNPKVEILQKWNYTFGDDETPLIGFPALQAQGIHVEIEDGFCRLTIARAAM
jgi:hypothetical protein